MILLERGFGLAVLDKRPKMTPFSLLVPGDVSDRARFLRRHTSLFTRMHQTPRLCTTLRASTSCSVCCIILLTKLPKSMRKVWGQNANVDNVDDVAMKLVQASAMLQFFAAAVGFKTHCEKRGWINILGSCALGSRSSLTMLDS